MSLSSSSLRARQLSQRGWSTDAVTYATALEFAARVTDAPEERETIARTLTEYPTASRVRGAFFDGLRRAAAGHGTPEQARELFVRAEVPESFVALRLYPTRDLCKLTLTAARAWFPALPLGAALARVAECFYPTFRETMAGKVMSRLLESEPSGVLQLLPTAYNLAAPWNEHELVRASEREVDWRCRVEPTPWYPDVFAGLVTGVARAHGAGPPRLTVLERSREGERACFLFRVQW